MYKATTLTNLTENDTHTTAIHAADGNIGRVSYIRIYLCYFCFR